MGRISPRALWAPGPRHLAPRERRSGTRTVLAATAAAALAMTMLPSAVADHTYEPPADPGSPGDATITVPVNDSAAGGTYYQPFERAYAGATPDGTPVYIYVPTGALSGDPTGVHSLDPQFDHNPDDEFVPCETATADEFVLTQEQIDYLGDALADQIVQVNEAHFGPMDAADPSDPASDSLVTLVYNVQDENYYDCTVGTYTAGYFAPDFINSLGMNVMVLDAFDWANRVGEDPSAAPWSDGDPNNDSPELYEGVVAHELEHLLQNYSDPGELSWVDEGLADMAAFLNGYDMTGSHLTYQQVFHRETSLTRWAGGLENYGASFSFFLYLWEQANRNAGGPNAPDLEYEGARGDLLIKYIFEEQADGMEGVQNALDRYRETTGIKLRPARQFFEGWVVTMDLDAEGSRIFDLVNFDLGPDSGGWTIDLANEVFFDNRGNYEGPQPPEKWNAPGHRPPSVALPFGASYEDFLDPGDQVGIEFTGDRRDAVAPYSGSEHWWGGYQSQADNILGLDTPVAAGQTVGFWNWHFIEEGWDFGFVEALVNGEWVTVPVTDDAGNVVSTDDDPHGNNTEGNGITGTSGGEYFVDEPQYLHYNAVVPDGATDMRFRYSTDAAYLDTGWFIDDVTVDGAEATVSPEGAGWVSTDGVQDNKWTVQVSAVCDLTPGQNSQGEIDDPLGNHIYRFRGDEISSYTLDTTCVPEGQDDFTIMISNLPIGDLTVLDAGYDYFLSDRSGG